MGKVEKKQSGNSADVDLLHAISGTQPWQPDETIFNEQPAAPKPVVNQWTPQQLAATVDQKNAETRKLVNSYIQTGVRGYLQQKEADKAYEDRALQDARTAFPGLPDEKLTSFAQQRAKALKEEATTQKQRTNDADYQQFLKKYSNPDYRNFVVGNNRFGKQVADTRELHPQDKNLLTRNIFTGRNSDYTEGDSKILQQRGSNLADNAPVNMDEVYDAQGNVKPEYLYKLYKATGGSQAKMYQAHAAYMSGKTDEYLSNPSIAQKQEQEDMNAMHDNAATKLFGDLARGPYYIARAAQGFKKGASAIDAATLTYAPNAIGEMMGADVNASHAYTQELQRLNKTYPTATAEGESSKWYNLDHLLSSGANFTGEFLPSIFLPEGEAAQSMLAQRLSTNYGGRLLLNSLHMTKTAAPQIFAGYVEDGLARGYSDNEAIARAMKHTPLNILAMSAGGATVGRSGKIAQGILNGGEEATGAAALLGKAGRFMKQPVVSGASFALGSLGDSYMNWQEDEVRRQQESEMKGTPYIPKPFDYKTALEDAGEQGGLGLLWGTMEHLVKSPHGALAGPSQAKYIYDAVSSPKQFDAALDRGVSRGTFSQGQADQLKAFRDRVTPYVAEASKNGMRPAVAAQYGVENARLQETAEAIKNLSAELRTVPVTDDKGDVQQVVYGREADGSYTERAGKDIEKKVNDLQAKAAESERSLKQIKDGTYVRGRLIKGDELLRLTSKYTPQGSLSTEQARRITGEGPWQGEYVPTEQFKGDPDVQRYVSMLGNKVDAEQYNTDLEKLREASTLYQSFAETKDSDGKIIKADATKTEEGQKAREDFDKAYTTFKERYPQWQKTTEGKLPFNDGKAIVDFDPINTNQPIVAGDGSIIDGKKRIAYAIVSGQDKIEVVRPRTMTETAKAVEEGRQDTPATGKPTAEGMPEKTAAAFEQAQNAYQDALHTDATEGQLQQGLVTPAARALDAAAEAIQAEGLPKEEAKDLLQHVSGYSISDAEAEQFVNKAAGVRPVEKVEVKAEDLAAPEAKGVEVVEAPHELSERWAKDEDVVNSDLWDKTRNRLKDGVTEDDIAQQLLGEPLPAKEAEPIAEEPKGTTVDYTTSSGNRVFVEDGVMKVVNKNGEAISDNTRRKAILEAAAQHDFTGEDTHFPDDARIWSNEQTEQYVAENSNNPSELATIWLYNEREGVFLSPEEEAIRDFGITTTTESFDMFGDKNYRTQSIAKSYLRDGVDKKAGQPLDTLADEITEHTGIKVTEQDLIDFMVRFPNGEKEAERTFLSETAQKAAQRFEEITGFQLHDRIPTTKKIAEIAQQQGVDKLAADERAELDKQLEHEYTDYEQQQRDYEQAIADGRIDAAAEDQQLYARPDNSASQEATPAIEGSAASEPGTTAEAGTAQQPAASDREAGEQARTVNGIVRGRANILVSSKTLADHNWTEKSVKALAERLRTAFGNDATVAIVDNAGMRKASGRGGKQSIPEAMYHDGVVYLNIESKSVKPSAALHEAGHMWKEWARVNAPELHAKGVELAKQTDAFKFAAEVLSGGDADPRGLSDADQKVWREYAEAYKGDADPLDSIADEILARGIQQSGKEIAGAKDLKSQFGKWLQAFWTKAKAAMGFAKLSTREFATLEFGDFTKRVAHEIGSGKELTRKVKEALAVVDPKADVATKERLVQEANLKAEVQDRLDIASDSKAKGVTNDEGDTEVKSVTSAAATKMASRITASDVIPVIEQAEPELISKLGEAIKESNLYATKEGEDTQKAESALLDFIDNPRGIEEIDRAIVGGIYRPGQARPDGTLIGTKGKEELHGIVGEVFDKLADIVNEKTGADVRGIDIANAFSDKADAIAKEQKAKEVRSARAKGEAKFALPDEANNAGDEQHAAFIDALQHAAGKQDREDFIYNAKNIIRNAYTEGIISRAEAHELMIAKQRADNPDKVAEFMQKIVDKYGRQEVSDVQESHEQEVQKTQFATALKHAVAEQELADRGQERVQRESHTKDERWEATKKRFATNPAVGIELVDAHSDGKSFNPTAEENYILAYELKRLQNALEETETAKIQADRKSDATESVKLGIELDKLNSRIDKTYTVNSLAGSEAGESFAVRQQFINADYSLGAIERRAEAAKGKPLTEAEKKGLDEIRKKKVRADKSLDEHKEGKAGAERGRAARKTYEATKKAAGKGKKDKGDKLQSLKDKWRSKLKVNGARFSLPETDAEGNDISGDVKQMIREFYRYFAEQGVKDVKEATEKVYLELGDFLPDATEREILDTYTGYGETSKPSEDPTAMTEAEWKQQGRLVSALEDADTGVPPMKSGFQRGKPSDEVRNLQRQVREAMKANGIDYGNPETNLASSLQATENRLRNELRDLDRQILAGKRDVKSKEFGPTSDTITDLKAQRDAKRNQLDALVGKPGMTEEQKVKVAIAITERAILDLRAKLDRGDLSKQPSNKIETPELKTLRDELKGLRDEMAQRRKDANPPKTKEEIATEAALKATVKRIAELEEMLDSGNVDPKKKQSYVQETQELKDLRDKRDDLQGQVDDIRKAQDAKTPEEVATEAAIKERERRIKELEETIANGGVATPDKPSLVDKTNPEYIANQQRVEALQQQLKDIQDAAGITEAKALDQWKKTITRNTAKVEQRRLNGEYEPKPKKDRVLDEEGMRLQAEAKRQRRLLDDAIAKYRYDNKAGYEKFFDAASRVQLMNKISGIYVLGKVILMDVTSSMVKPLEEGVGHVMSYVPGFKQVGTKAYSEGRAHFKAESVAWAKGLVKGFKEMPAILKGEINDKKAIYGKERGYAPKYWVDHVAHLHEALKNPLFEAAFQQSAAKQAENMLTAGIDVTDATVKEKIGNTAFQAGLRAIYANDNAYATTIKRLIDAVEYDKGHNTSPGRKFLAFLMHTFLPVNKVPGNIINEIGIRITGVPHVLGRGMYHVAKEAIAAKDVAAYKRLAVGWERAVDKLTPEQCDYVYRLFKKGSVGLGFTVLGLMLFKSIGGMRTADKKEENGVREHEMNINGFAVPKWMQENTGMQAMQFAATGRKLYNEYTHKHMSTTGAVALAGLKSFMGLSQEIPFVNTTGRVTGVLNAKGVDKPANFASDWISSNFVPALSRDVAKMTDKDEKGFMAGHTVQRTPAKASKVGFIQHTWQKIKTGIPGLREQVKKK